MHSYARYVELSEGIEREGVTYEATTKSGAVTLPRPEVSMRAQAWRELAKMLVEFGMTPSARSRIHVPPPDAPDPFETFLGRRPS